MKELMALVGDTFPNNNQYCRSRNTYRMNLSFYSLLFLFCFNFQFPAQASNSVTMEEITLGSAIPHFSLHDQHGKTFNISTVLGKKNLVIYFYPKDDSPVCTKQACSFRDQFEVFKVADALIIGISSGSVTSHKEFAEKYNLNFTLLSDEGNRVRKLFGVPTNFLGLVPGRVTYIVNKEGKVVFVFNSLMNGGQHVNEAINMLKELK